MKKLLIALILGIGVFGYTAVAQDSTRTDKKGRKVAKKWTKGKHHKALKKAYKMDKKANKDK
jgi:hypothetical protein